MTEIAMADCIKRYRKRGRRTKKKSNRQKELETADREGNDRKVRGRKKATEKNHGQLTPDDRDAKKTTTITCNLTII